MDTDFNFPMALAVIFEGIRRVNRIAGPASHAPAAALPHELDTVTADLAFMCREILGIKFDACKETTDGRASGIGIDLETV